MPSEEVEVEVPRKTEAHAARPSFVARAMEWFWRGAALRAARSHSPYPRPDQEELVRRAQLAAEGGARLLEPSPPFDAGSPDALAFELYRQSIHWSLAATLDASTPDEAGAVEAREPLDNVPDAVLSRLPESRASLAELSRQLVGLDFVSFSSLPLPQQRELARRVARVADALLERALEPGRRSESLLFQRFARVGALLLLLVAVAFGLSHLARRFETDLAMGQPWRTSSVGHGGCTSPAQDCGSGFFFHTQAEQGPWLEIDLGKSQQFSKVRIENRSDCCSERAVPLLVEVSGDGQHYQQVARRDDDFQSWSAGFEPVTARYVRVRSAARTMLHLGRVSVLR